MSQEFCRLEQLPQNSTVAIYGAGGRGVLLRDIIRTHRADITISAFIDSYKGGDIDETPIITLAELLDSDPARHDFIIIGSTFLEEILANLPDAYKQIALVPSHYFFNWYGHEQQTTSLFSTFHIETNTDCNMACRFCTSNFRVRHGYTQRGQMELGTFEKLVDEIARDRLADTISFLGGHGDPLLYKHLIDAVVYAAGKGLGSSITTNGLSLDRETYLALHDAGLGILNVSLNNLTQESFECRGLRGKGNVYDQYLERILDCVDAYIEHGHDRPFDLRIMLAFPETPGARVFDVKGLVSDSLNLEETFGAFARKLDSTLNRHGLSFKVSEESVRCARDSMRESREATSYPVVGNMSVSFVALNPTRYSSLYMINADLYNLAKIQIPGTGFCSVGDPSVALSGNLSICCSVEPEVSLGNWLDGKHSLLEMLTGNKCHGLVMGYVNGKLPYNFCKVCTADYVFEEGDCGNEADSL